MIKRIVVTGLKARGYVDGRYVGEDKKEGARERTDVLGTPKRRGKAGAGAGTGVGKGRGKKRGVGAGGLPADNLGNATAGKRGKRGKTPGRGPALGGQAAGAGVGNTFGQPPAGRGGRGQPRSQPRRINPAARRRSVRVPTVCRFTVAVRWPTVDALATKPNPASLPRRWRRR
jgi:hypothetical protein